jgi:hypothetical protein
MSTLRVVFIATCAFVTAAALHELRKLDEWAKPVTIETVLRGGQVSAAERALRPNYPYSVIPGGAYSPEELRDSIAKDKFVKAHYTDFDAKSAHLVTLAEDRFQYVSYRLNNRILWTHKKIRIPKGEVLLTDGTHFARTRCGNRLCAGFIAPASFTLAPLEKLALPPFTIDLLSRERIPSGQPPDIDIAEKPPLHFELGRLAPYTPSAAPMPAATPLQWAPIAGTPTLVVSGGAYPVFSSTPIPSPTPSPPVPLAGVPEPSSTYLLITGFVVLFWFASRCIRATR